MYRLALLLYAVSAFAAADTPAREIILNSWLPSSDISHGLNLSDKIVSEAFKVLEIPLTVEQLPPERSIREANSGIVDGEYMRISSIASIYPNLVKVPQAIGTIEFVAFSHKNNLDLSQGWNSFENYSVGYVTGWKIIEHNISHIEQAFAVGSADTLFSMLGAKRFDVAIYSKRRGLEILNKLELKGIHPLKPLLSSQKMYLFMHKKHLGLIPALSDAIARVKKRKNVSL